MQETLEYNTRTFGKGNIGIHNGELPKFAQKHWKGHFNVEQAENEANELLLRSRNYWITKRSNENPCKLVYVAQTRKASVTGKINELIYPSKETTDPINKIKRKVRWSSKIQEFINKSSAFSTEVRSVARTERKEPLNSSLTPEKILPQASFESNIKHSYNPYNY